MLGSQFIGFYAENERLENEHFSVETAKRMIIVVKSSHDSSRSVEKKKA